MNKAEEKALKAYPVDMTPFGDDNRSRREAYLEGYRSGEKDTMQKALGVIKNYCDTHLLYEGHRVKLQQFFKKEMEGK